MNKVEKILASLFAAVLPLLFIFLISMDGIEKNMSSLIPIAGLVLLCLFLAYYFAKEIPDE